MEANEELHATQEAVPASDPSVTPAADAEESKNAASLPETGDPVSENPEKAPEEDACAQKTATKEPPVDYAGLAASDLATLKEEFPELQDLSDLSELRGAARYGALRDLGLSPREAYLATRPAAFEPNNRSHLKSRVPKAAYGDFAGMTPSELSAARELFSGLSDSEIRKLYQKVTK